MSLFIAPDGKLIYIIVEERADFDKLAVPAEDHDDRGDKGHLLTKVIDHASIYVVFQHWIKSPRQSPSLSRVQQEEPH